MIRRLRDLKTSYRQIWTLTREKCNTMWPKKNCTRINFRSHFDVNICQQTLHLLSNLLNRPSIIKTFVRVRNDICQQAENDVSNFSIELAELLDFDDWQFNFKIQTLTCWQIITLTRAKLLWLTAQPCKLETEFKVCWQIFTLKWDWKIIRVPFFWVT